MPASTSTTPELPPLDWTAHPLREEPLGKTVLLCSIIMGFAIGVALLYEALYWGFISWGVLTAALSRYFLPTHYRLDERGIEVTHLRRHLHPWSAFRRAVVHTRGIFLSPFARPHRLDSFRGVHLRLGPQTARAIDLVQHHVPAAKP